jgi:hypothetical protein
MKVTQISEGSKEVYKRLLMSYDEWREYVSDSVKQTTLTKKLPKIINELRNTLEKFDDKFLGKYNYFLDVKYLRKKTEEMYNRSKNLINK